MISIVDARFDDYYKQYVVLLEELVSNLLTNFLIIWSLNLRQLSGLLETEGAIAAQLAFG